MTTHEITVALRQDEPWIKKLYSQAKKEIGSFNLWHSWDDYLSDKRGVFLIIRPKAFVRYTHSKKKGVYVVQEIAVAKEFQGEGCGYELMKAVPKPILLKCNQENQKGNEFYTKIGMQKTGETKTKKGVPQNIYYLCAELSDTLEGPMALF